jgi:hypothetical protein
MRRIMLCGAGSLGAVLAAQLMREATTRLGHKVEVLITDDTGRVYVNEATDGQPDVRVLSVDEAQLLIAGASPPEFGLRNWATLNERAICELSALTVEPLHSGPTAKYLRNQSRHTMSRKQQSLQAKARRR